MNTRFPELASQEELDASKAPTIGTFIVLCALVLGTFGIGAGIEHLMTEHNAERLEAK